MGTRADFYVGRDVDSMEWIGSIPMNGYPTGHPRAYLAPKMTETEFRAAVAAMVAAHCGTRPDQGWPWPWSDSTTTDRQYLWDGGEVWVTAWGHHEVRFTGNELPPDHCDGSEREWPDMTHVQTVVLGPRSGLIILTAEEE